MLFVILKTFPCNPSTQKFEVMGLPAYIVTSKPGLAKKVTHCLKNSLQDKTKTEMKIFP